MRERDDERPCSRRAAVLDLPTHLTRRPGKCAPHRDESTTTRRDQVNGLLLLVAAGDREALADLYVATSDKLFAVAFHILKNRFDAEEVVQETYVRVWLHAGRFRCNELSPMTWLIVVARNLALDQARHRARRQSDPLIEAEDLPDLAPSPEDAAQAEHLRARVSVCLGALAPCHAEAVIAAYVHGESYAELAARFGVPLNTMRTNLRRSLRKIRTRLAAEGVTER